MLVNSVQKIKKKAEKNLEIASFFCMSSHFASNFRLVQAEIIVSNRIEIFDGF
jgi:hypothetical protein